MKGFILLVNCHFMDFSSQHCDRLILGFVFTDASYSDPLGPQMERPKTAAARKQDNDDLFDEDVGDDLLPE